MLEKLGNAEVKSAEAQQQSEICSNIKFTPGAGLNLTLNRQAQSECHARPILLPISSPLSTVNPSINQTAQAGRNPPSASAIGIF
jgi:hypothetical protein